MNINYPLITSILDNDFYTFTVGQLVFNLFPRAKVSYKFINRNNRPFPKNFSNILKDQICNLSVIELKKDEKKWLSGIPYLLPTYIEWIGSYKFDPSEVHITQTDEKLEVEINGYWYRTIFWEVVLMALISELYFLIDNKHPDDNWRKNLVLKSKTLSNNNCQWIDFGTRRRFSFDVHNEVVATMKNYNGFLGTSNVFLAKHHNLIAHGTYSHQGPMAMQALYGDFYSANKMWMKHWSEHFDGNVGIALTDTFTTDVFLKSFGTYEARLFDGLRQDSGDPIKWGNRVLKHYEKLKIPTNNKRLVFSDGLDPESYVRIHNTFCEMAKPVAGIGTNLTNDVGVKPLNMVIKLTQADFGNGFVDVIKLSDNVNKASGNPSAVEYARKKLGIL